MNRLSIGIQSFNDAHLHTLGRIHHRDAAYQAIEMAKHAGFTNFNLDLMFGLPNQTIEEALKDLQCAITANPTHISWYQLTLEPNTLFYKSPPTLPDDDHLWEMQIQGQTLLANAGYKQYEISAYSKPDYPCRHNLNYWRFGDYLGIGAGAHSKLTLRNNDIIRFHTIKHPTSYLNHSPEIKPTQLSQQDKLFEFMLNALRLNEPVNLDLFYNRTGLTLNELQPKLDIALEQKLMTQTEHELTVTDLGRRFLNDVQGIFL